MESVEIVFEKINISNIENLFSMIFNENKSVLFELNSEFYSAKKLESLSIAVQEMDLDELYISINTLLINDILLKNIFLRFWKYNINDIDLEILINSKFFVNSANVISIMNWSQKAASAINCKYFFCGYEPAFDKETRLFTNGKLGPIIL